VMLAFRTDVAIRMRRTIAIEVRTETAMTTVISTVTARRWVNSWKWNHFVRCIHAKYCPVIKDL